MAFLESYMPPSRENWELLTYCWQFYPIVSGHPWISYAHLTVDQFASFQFITKWYPAGKTSTESRLNIPGKIGWATMEAPGFITLLYIMLTLPQKNGIEHLPGANWLMAALFVRLQTPSISRIVNAKTPSPLLDDPLHLPRPRRSSSPQSEHVPNASLHLDQRAHFSSLQCDLHWRLASGLRTHNDRRLGRSRLCNRSRDDDLRCWFVWEYLS